MKYQKYHFISLLNTVQQLLGTCKIKPKIINKAYKLFQHGLLKEILLIWVKIVFLK